MKKIILFALIIWGLNSCQQKVDEKSLVYINGYWEIDEVKTPDSETKMYGQNTAIDYIELKDSVGFRQKLIPQLDGKYLTNQIKESIRVEYEGGDLYLNSETNYAQWREEIVSLDSLSMTIKNSQNIIYKYKRFEPISINNE